MSDIRLKLDKRINRQRQELRFWNELEWTSGWHRFRKLHDTVWRWYETRRDELIRLRKENARLREALKPFEDIAGEGSEDFPDTERVFMKFGRTINYTATLGDLRRARAALTRTQEDKPYPNCPRCDGPMKTREVQMEGWTGLGDYCPRCGWPDGKLGVVEEPSHE